MALGSLKRDYNSPKILYRFTSQGHDILSSLKVAIYDLFMPQQETRIISNY
jgi:hypothetical protein